MITFDPKNAEASANSAVELLSTTARSGERLVVLCGQKVVVADSAPAKELKAPPPTVPPMPKPLRRGHTEFQQKQYDIAVQKHNDAVAQAQRLLHDQQDQQVKSWVDSLRPKFAQAPTSCPTTDPEQAFSASIDAAEATFASLAQATSASAKL